MVNNVRRRCFEIVTDGGGGGGDKPTGPLYPITERTSGQFAGTGGNIGAYDRADGGVSYIGLLNAGRGTSSTIYNNKAKKFTIPANSDVVFSVQVNRKSGTFTLYGLRIANASSAFLGGSGTTMTAGNTYTFTATTTEDVDIGEIGFKMQTSSGTRQYFNVTISLTVDGVQYI